MTHESGTEQGRHGEHEHADPEGDGDVPREHLEHNDDACVVRADADPEHDGGQDLAGEAGPELGHQHRGGVEEENGGGEVESARPEPVQDRPEHDLAHEVAGAVHAEQEAGVRRADSEPVLRPVGHEGVGGEDS